MGTQRRNCFLWQPIWFGASHKTMVLGDGSLLKHWTRAQNWRSIWFGTSYWTSVLWYVYLLRHGRRAHEGGEKEKNDVWHDLRHHIRCQFWDIDLIWDIGQGHKADVLCDLGCHIGHQFGRWISFETSEEGVKLTSYMIWTIGMSYLIWDIV
jgi:hypothetical protein